MVELEIDETVMPALQAAAGTTLASGSPTQIEREGVWALALPLGLSERRRQRARDAHRRTRGTAPSARTSRT